MPDAEDLERKVASALARLEARGEREPLRVWKRNRSTCLHDESSLHRLGEIGSARLQECQDCGLVMGVAR